MVIFFYVLGVITPPMLLLRQGKSPGTSSTDSVDLIGILLMTCPTMTDDSHTLDGARSHI